MGATLHIALMMWQHPKQGHSGSDMEPACLGDRGGGGGGSFLAAH